MRILTVILIGASGLTACLEGPGLFQKDGNAEASYSVVTTSDNGVTSGAFSSTNAATQAFGVQDGTIKGSAVAFPPGSLAIDTKVSLEEGAKIVSASLAKELGIGTTLSSGGPAVVLSSSIAIDGSSSFLLNLPRKSKSSALADVFTVVVYRVFNATEDRYMVGVIPTADIKISADAVTISTKYFGSYQIAESPVKIANAVVKTSATPVLTKNAEKELPKASLALSLQSFDNSLRKATFNAKASIKLGLDKCSIFYLKDPKYEAFTSKSLDAGALKQLSNATAYTLDYVVESLASFSLYARLDCLDEYGRNLVSNNTKELVVPLKDDGDSATAGLAFVGNAALSTSPKTHRLIAYEAEKVLQGTCETDNGAVDIFVDGLTGNASKQLVTCTNDTFQISMSSISSCTGGGGTFCLGAVNGGYRIYAAQDYTAFDETVVYVHSSPNSVVEVSAGSFTSSTLTSNSFMILTEDVTLTGNWPAGVYMSNTLEGDLHTISGFAMSVSGTSNVTDFGMFATLSGKVRHLNFAAPSLTINLSSVANADRVGIVAGYLSATGVIEHVTIDDGHVSVTSASTSYQVGGVVGYSVGTMGNVNFLGSTPGSYNAYVDAGSAYKVGGLVGYISVSGSLGAVADSQVYRARVKGFGSIGGLVGDSTTGSPGTTLITRSKFEGAIESTYASSANIMMGGIVGYINSNGVVSEVEARATAICASPSVYNIGGIAGNLAGALLNVSASIMSSTCLTEVGGLAGYMIGSTAQIQQGVAHIVVTGSCVSCGYIAGIGSGTVDSLTNIVVPADSLINGAEAALFSTVPSSSSKANIIIDDSYTFATACPASGISSACAELDLSSLITVSYANYGWDMSKWGLFTGTDEPMLLTVPVSP